MSSDYIKRAAIYQNIAKSYFGASNPSGLQTGATKYQADGRDSAESLALDYLQASKFTRMNIDTWSSIIEYHSPIDRELQLLHNVIGEQGTERLPKPLEIKVRFGEVLKQRRSVRRFSSDELPAVYLSTLLSHAAGITHTHPAEEAGGRELSLRAYPSGGALYPVDFLLLVRRIAGIKSGIFEYFPASNSCKQVGEGTTIEGAIDSLIGLEELSRDLPLVIVLTMRPWRSMRKYGCRGLRFVLHELGSIAQNIHLTATALGLATTDWASFEEDRLNTLLGFDGVFKSVGHLILVGRPAE